MGYITIDSSTSSTTVLVFDDSLKVLKRFQKEHKQIYTKEGYIEHDLEEIFQNLIELVKQASFLSPDPKFISITNQRETFSLFKKKTGKPIHNAIVWQCTRGQKICDDLLSNKELTQTIKKKTGLQPNTFFSGSKLNWLIENNSEINSKIESEEICFGTIETYLIYRLTYLESFVTDTTNASRTLLFNCLNNKWDEELLSIFNIKNIQFPKIKKSSEFFGESDFEGSFNKRIPIIGVAGDAQASFFANSCFKKGDTKITTGTGFNIQTNIGEELLLDDKSFTSLAFTNKQNTYALECLGSFAGGTVSWVKNNLQLIKSVNESEEFSMEIESSNGVFFVPAFSGLGPPYWISSARSAFFGINPAVDKRHLTRAALESVAFQMIIYLEFLQKSKNLSLNNLSIDGGMIKNKFFTQLIADLTQTDVNIPEIEDMSSYGVLLLGIQYLHNITNLNDLEEFRLNHKLIRPKQNKVTQTTYDQWKLIIDKHFLKNQH
jgi:glycerol kinase